MKIQFTHIFVLGWGWENTVHQPEDYLSVEHIQDLGDENHIFGSLGEGGILTIFKGYYQ